MGSVRRLPSGHTGGQTEVPTALDSFRPLQYAQGLGIHCVSIPHFVALLLEVGRISQEAALGYLDRLAPVTSPALIAEARAVIEKLES